MDELLFVSEPRPRGRRATAARMSERQPVWALAAIVWPRSDPWASLFQLGHDDMRLQLASHAAQRLVAGDGHELRGSATRLRHR
jgi:hypothetical protein